jgi:hypothetical protein
MMEAPTNITYLEYVVNSIKVQRICRFLVDCCLPQLLPAPVVAKAVGVDVTAALSAAVFASATAAAAHAAASTSIYADCG